MSWQLLWLHEVLFVSLASSWWPWQWGFIGCHHHLMERGEFTLAEHPPSILGGKVNYEVWSDILPGTDCLKIDIHDGA